MSIPVLNESFVLHIAVNLVLISDTLLLSLIDLLIALLLAMIILKCQFNWYDVVSHR